MGNRFEWWDAAKVWERSYPRIVKAILIKRSAPQPATMKTPMGGTIGCDRCQLCDQIGEREVVDANP